MKWTKELPTKVGWYWHRANPHDSAALWRVDVENGRADFRLVVVRDGRDDQPYVLALFDGEEWAGPIPKPE